MGLRLQAEQDLGAILEDGATGFGWPVILTSPTDFTSTNPLTGFSNDIAQVIDPDTGEAVSGRSASVALRISSIYAAGYTELPKGVFDTTSKPWRVTFDDINGTSHTFKIVQSNPDRMIGILSCILELYE